MTHICVFMLSGMSGMSMCVCQLWAGCSAVHPTLPVVLCAHHCPSESSEIHMFKKGFDLHSRTSLNILNHPKQCSHLFLYVQKCLITAYTRKRHKNSSMDIHTVVCHCSVIVLLCPSDKSAVRQKGMD